MRDSDSDELEVSDWETLILLDGVIDILIDALGLEVCVWDGV